MSCSPGLLSQILLQIMMQNNRKLRLHYSPAMSRCPFPASNSFREHEVSGGPSYRRGDTGGHYGGLALTVGPRAPAQGCAGGLYLRRATILSHCPVWCFLFHPYCFALCPSHPQKVQKEAPPSGGGRPPSPSLSRNLSRRRSPSPVAMAPGAARRSPSPVVSRYRHTSVPFVLEVYFCRI